jgi:hypothetical protein
MIAQPNGEHRDTGGLGDPGGPAVSVHPDRHHPGRIGADGSVEQCLQQ